MKKGTFIIFSVLFVLVSGFFSAVSHSPIETYGLKELFILLNLIFMMAGTVFSVLAVLSYEDKLNNTKLILIAIAIIATYAFGFYITKLLD